jgi:hypothetical protein
MRSQDPNPYASPESDNPPVERTARSNENRPSLWHFIIQATVYVVLSALFLDGGRQLRVTSIAVFVQLALILLIVLRRRGQYTKVDVFVIHWGLIFVLVLATFAASLLGR